MTRRISLGMRVVADCFVAGLSLVLAACGGSAVHTPPPVVLTVSLANDTVQLAQGGTVVVPVVVVAPTETVTLAIAGLPAGVAESYKESESNPSGQLTLMASSIVPIGTYMPVISVSSSGQTATQAFKLVVTGP